MPRTLAKPLALAFLVAATPLAAQVPAADYELRRDSLARQLGGGTLLVLGAPGPAQDYLTFHQDPTFRYLTGITEPDGALLVTRRGDATVAHLFVSTHDPVREVWSGRRMGPDSAARLTGVPTRPIQELPAVLDSLLQENDTLRTAGTATQAWLHQPEIRRGLAQGEARIATLRAARPGLVVLPMDAQVMPLRARKSDAELDLIRRAVDVTVIAQRDAMRLVEPGLNEFEVQALVEYTFRRYGADRPAFASIVGSGPNATTLHYNRNDRFMQAGEMVVIDVGASYRGYSADVTRSLPVSGTFSPEQREIYQVVRDAQAAAERQARPGTPWRVLQDSARHTIATGLARIGLIDSATATYACGTRQCPQVALFFIHGLGHGIGLQVHDPDLWDVTGNLGVGSVFTIEPGVYVRENLLDVIPDVPANRALRERIGKLLPRYANIGVRIEDDFLVTANGLEHLSKGAPREIDEIEALMREPWTGPSERRAEVVEWYRSTGW